MNLEPYLLEGWTWWTIFVCPNQANLGRIVFLVNERQNGTIASQYTDLDQQEEFIFKLRSRILKKVLDQLFQPDEITWLMTSENGRCQIELIPRYKTPRKFAGLEFEDRAWVRRPQQASLAWQLMPDVTDRLRTEIRQLAQPLIYSRP